MGTFEMNLHEAAVIDLINLGRRRGGLTMEDLRKVLPISSMTTDEITHALARLDEAGVDVAVDATLFLPMEKAAVTNATPAAKCDEAAPPKPMLEERRQQTDLAASLGEPALKDHERRRSESSASEAIYPWLIGFAIILAVVFAAFAF
jgi:hypothetical protein